MLPVRACPPLQEGSQDNRGKPKRHRPYFLYRGPGQARLLIYSARPEPRARGTPGSRPTGLDVSRHRGLSNAALSRNCGASPPNPKASSVSRGHLRPSSSASPSVVRNRCAEPQLSGTVLIEASTDLKPACPLGLAVISDWPLRPTDRQAVSTCGIVTPGSWQAAHIGRRRSSAPPECFDERCRFPPARRTRPVV